MAIGTPSESPAITVTEIDRSGVVPNVQTTTGAFVGNFNWGPVQQATLVSNETSLVDTFGSPDSSNTIEFHSAAYFLRYANSLQVVREVTSAAFNSYDSDANATVLVKNRDNWDDQIAARDSDKHTFIGKFPGNLGNSIKVSILPADSGDATTIFDAWTYKSSFDAAPTTSTHAADRNASGDEAHVAVIDEDGLIGGTKGAVLERFPFVSLANGALNTDGSTNFIKDVINNQSEYVWMAGFGDADKFSAEAGTTVDSGDNYLQLTGTPAEVNISLKNGINSGTLTTSEMATGFDKFEDVDTVTVDFLIAPGMSSRTDQTTVVNDLITIAQTTRKDCVVVASPARSDIVASTTPVTNAVTTADTFTKSSYLFMDNNYLKVYDKYNDQYHPNSCFFKYCWYYGCI